MNYKPSNGESQCQTSCPLISSESCLMKIKGLLFEDAEFLSNARIRGLNDFKKLKDIWEQRFVCMCGGGEALEAKCEKCSQLPSHQ